MDTITSVYKGILKKGDPYMEDWPMVKYPHAMLWWLAAYLAMVILLPKLMKSRQGFQLKTILICYNFGMIFLNMYIFIQTATSAIELGYEFSCPKYEHISTSSHLKMSSAIYLYFLAKFIELSDTLFLILRKKGNQLTALHVYHHSSMTIILWIMVKVNPGGVVFLFPLLNCPVHVVMYTYYGLAALGPKAKKYLWWKKYMTQMQLIQFAMGLFGLVRGLYKNCEYAIEVIVLGPPYISMFLILFLHFYLTAYTTPKKIISNEVKNKLS